MIFNLRDIYDAIKLALEAHKNQYRKLDGDIYAAHPLEVAILLAGAQADEEVQIAGVLHDTLEDTDVNFDLILQQFGPRVARLVQECSEPNKALPWKIRKVDALAVLKNTASEEVKLIILADKLSNIKSIYRNSEQMGDSLWNHFNADYTEQRWYFYASLEALSSLSHLELYKRFELYVHQVFDRP